MGVFFNAGSEATTAALGIARRATGRRAIARCGYHGWHDWCVAEMDHVPAGLAEQVLCYDAMRPETLTALFEQHPGKIAAVIVAPEMIHPPSRDKVVTLIEATHRAGALFIIDEVKTGIRAPGGSMQQYYDVKPDLTTLSKALGNGWPIAALIGTREVMQHAEGLPISATYHAFTPGMAAALQTLRIVERTNAPHYVDVIGRRLIEGLSEAVARHGVPARAYGEPIAAMPFLSFADADCAIRPQLEDAFYTEMLAQGMLLHPRHLWYISTAHTPDDVDRTIAAVDTALRHAAAVL
jgi:glutamate-1-semialdehyde aminotransferase